MGFYFFKACLDSSSFVLVHEEIFIGAEKGLSDVKRGGKVAHIFAVMEVMVSGAVDEGQHSGEGPWELIATMSFWTGEGFVAQPEQNHEHVRFDDGKCNGGRQLN